MHGQNRGISENSKFIVGELGRCLAFFSNVLARREASQVASVCALWPSTTPRSHAVFFIATKQQSGQQDNG